MGIDLADAAAVCAFAAERDLLVQYYVGDHIYVRPTCDEHRDLVRRYHELTGASHTTVDEYPLTESPAKMLLMTDDPDGVLAIVREAQASGALPSGLASIRGSPPFFVEMLGTGVYKGSGLAKLCERRGVALDVALVVRVMREAELAAQYNRAVCEAQARRTPVFFLWYEDLLRDPEPTFDALQRFLGVEPRRHQSVAQHHELGEAQRF